MKKFVNIIVIAIFCVAFLTSCGKDEEAIPVKETPQIIDKGEPGLSEEEASDLFDEEAVYVSIIDDNKLLEQYGFPKHQKLIIGMEMLDILKSNNIKSNVVVLDKCLYSDNPKMIYLHMSVDGYSESYFEYIYMADKDETYRRYVDNNSIHEESDFDILLNNNFKE